MARAMADPTSRVISTIWSEIPASSPWNCSRICLSSPLVAGPCVGRPVRAPGQRHGHHDTVGGAVDREPVVARERA